MARSALITAIGAALLLLVLLAPAVIAVDTAASETLVSRLGTAEGTGDAAVDTSDPVASVDVTEPVETAAAADGGVDLSRVVELSPWSPRAYLYRGFLTDDECDHIVQLAAPRLERSGVVNNDDGSSFVSEIRTSSGAFIHKAEDAVVARVEQRISEWTFLPLPNQESLQVLRYTTGQKYEPHVDYFHDPVNTQRGGHRYATVLMYLNNVTLGGETVFPNVKDDSPKDASWSDCAKGFLAVKPAKGDALLFFNLHPDGTPDPDSLHYACPVVEGVKWSAPKWIHVGDFDKPLPPASPSSAPNACTDTNVYCSYWSTHGECEKNPAYMMDACRKSCKAC